ncbi:MAG: Holliday junction resolvase RuvX [bacterium]|nr:Holliday junction resolvase RuvX [bacterium]MDA1024625.1 Holliday junction resolvase RuvX [bacterium]
MRYLGVDFGEKKVGLALGDNETKLATPLEVIPGGDDLAKRIIDLVREEGIDELVIGVPGEAGDFHDDSQAKRVRGFIEELKGMSNMPIHTVDEQFTTAESRRLVEEYGATAPEDALAAMLILQSYLDES